MAIFASDLHDLFRFFLFFWLLFFGTQVQAYKQKASILEGLGQTHDALHQLHLGLECLEGEWNGQIITASSTKCSSMSFNIMNMFEKMLNLRFHSNKYMLHPLLGAQGLEQFYSVTTLHLTRLCSKQNFGEPFGLPSTSAGVPSPPSWSPDLINYLIN